MSSHTPFIKAEWVSVGKKWNDIPAEGSVINGYKLDEEGSIVRTGVAENEEQQAGEDDAEASVIVPAAELGRGCQVKIGSKRFNAEWEEH